MKPSRWIPLAVICLWLAGGFQGVLSSRITIGGASPDFFLVVIAVLGLFCDRRKGIYLGFWSGVIQGALTGANLGGYVVTRTVGGLLVGAMGGFELEPNPYVAGIQGAVVTVVTQLLLLLISPSGSIPRFLLVTIEGAVYNGVLASLLFLMVGKMLVARNR